MSTESMTGKLVLRDYPILQWLIGGVFMAVGVFMMLDNRNLVFGIVMTLVGAAVAIFLGPITTVTADRLAGTLTVQRRSLVQNMAHEYMLQDITGVEVDSHMSSGGGRHHSRTPVYCPVLILKTGEMVPLQYGYSSGHAGKAHKAQQLREYLGLAAGAALPSNPVQAMQQITRQVQLVQEGTTDDIPWQAVTTPNSSSPVTRWYSSAFHYPGHFLLLAQKPEGSGGFSGGGLLGAISQALFQQMLGLYAFAPEDTPGLAGARSMEPPEPQLDRSFATLASDPPGASRWVNLSVSGLLLRWSQEHPLQQFQRAGQGQPGQLVVLLSPRGLYVGSLAAATPELIAELADLGVKLVRALGLS